MTPVIHALLLPGVEAKDEDGQPAMTKPQRNRG